MYNQLNISIIIFPSECCLSNFYVYQRGHGRIVGLIFTDITIMVCDMMEWAREAEAQK